ncbi:amphi-Trp domain-containing protein [Streptomyces sp. NBC_00289]|uniref:amphi-Trp domain-containing protein n=1 Tax=Streptomyces sp. NBC_00289 TaxID=2975703 RepID=UPI0032523BF2
MRDLKFEQKRSLSRREAADQLTALAAALREGGDAELDLGSGKVSLRIPDNLRSEVEIEAGNGEIELEIELKWPTASSRTASSQATADTDEAPRGRKSAPAKPGRTSTGKNRAAKPSATKTP